MNNTQKFPNVTHHDQLVEPIYTYLRSSIAGKVLIYLSFCGKKTRHGEWYARPAKSTIAANCEVSERSVYTAIGLLEKAGLLRTIKGRGKKIGFFINIAAVIKPAKHALDIIFGDLPSKLCEIVTSSLANRKAMREGFDVAREEKKKQEQKKNKKTEVTKPVQPPKQHKPFHKPSKSAAKLFRARKGGRVEKNCLHNKGSLNKTSLEDQKTRASAIPSPEKIMPSKRTIEFLWECGKSAIKTIPSKIAALIAKKAPQNEIERLQSELKRQQDILEKHAPLAEYYGLSLA